MIFIDKWNNIMCAFSKTNITENYRRLTNTQRIFEDAPSFRNAADKLHPDVITSYLEAAIWTSDDELDGQDFDINDFSQDAINKSKRDLEMFIDQAEEEGVLDPYLDAIEGNSWGSLGHDFWLTRNGHGTGYWDRNEIDSDVRTKLSDMARKFKEVNVFVGDDGKLIIE